jgi:hypothetical protein
VPARIQDLIERNIRTLSNSISNKSDSSSILHVSGHIDLSELKEQWLTKKEQFLLKNERTSAPNMQSIESPRNRKVTDKTENGGEEARESNPLVKYKQKKGEQHTNE